MSGPIEPYPPSLEEKIETSKRRKKQAKAQRKLEKKRDKKVRRRLRRRIPAAARAPSAARPMDPRVQHIDELMASPLGSTWLADFGTTSAQTGPGLNAPMVVAPLPRRRLIDSPPAGTHTPPMAKRVQFDVSSWYVFWRLLFWYWGAIRFLLGTLWDEIRQRNTVEAQARRLRRTFERLGPTFVKVGQQLSIRADVLPYAFCEELAKMLDNVPPFTFEEARREIELRAGKKMDDIFAVFDPKPIGSASIACVFQAVLQTGERVAVKVRRPNIGPVLTADLEALGWAVRAIEYLSILKTGMAATFQKEMRNMLLEELDFTREARYTDIFRRRAVDVGYDFITAPKVFFELSSESVLITEFIEGVWMWELLGAVDRGDKATLDQLHALDIDPKMIARHLVQIFNWETLESSLFHADPHPANIVVKPGNIITFIDFGACGRFSSRTRRLWHEMHYHLANEDASGVVATSLALLEPLPPIDLNSFSKELEAVYWDYLYALNSEHAEWWEKATGVFYFKIIAISRKYSVPMALDTLRLFRTVFSYDAIVFRLWTQTDMEGEYRKFARRAGERSRKRVRKFFLRRLSDGPRGEDYMQIEEMMRMGRQIMYRIQHYLDTPDHRFTEIVSKAAFGLSMLLKLLPIALIAHGGVVLIMIFVAGLRHQALTYAEALTKLVTSPFYQLTVFFVLVALIRRLIFRLDEVDENRD